MNSINFSSIKTIVGLLMGALFVVLATCAIGWVSSSRVERTFKWVDHTHLVLYELEATLTHAVGIQSGTRGFALTGEDRYLAPYESGLARIQQSVARLRELTADNLRQQNRLTHLSSLIDEEIAVMKQRIDARRKGGLNAASAATADGRGKQVMDAIRGIIASMQDEERALLLERSKNAQTVGWTAVLILIFNTAVASGLIGSAITRARLLPQKLGQPTPA